MTHQESLVDFGDLRICVALDHSGSTWGVTLKEEIKAVQTICYLLSPSNENPLLLLPWCDKTKDPICLPKESAAMYNLDSSGGTNPSVLYSSPACLQALSTCGLWFLFTDGEIQDNLVQDFALSTAEQGLHGIACVVVVFGKCSTAHPANCDISVGVATYAVAPDCLFLFHDIPTGKLSILGAKGCFKKLLSQSGSSYVQPNLSRYTTWAELPHITYGDLSSIRISPPKKVTRDEIALQDDIVVKMQDLYSGTADPETVGAIARNQDSLKSIVIAEMTRGNGKELQTWLEAQQKPEPELTLDRPDISGKAQKVVTHLLERLKIGDPNEKLDGLRGNLRQAHMENWLAFIEVLEQQSVVKSEVFKHNRVWQRAWEHSRSIETAPRVQRGRSSSFASADLSATYSVDEDESEDEYGCKYKVEDDERNEEDLTLVGKSATATTEDCFSNTFGYKMQSSLPSRLNEKVDQCFLPGFKREPGHPEAEFVGRCMLCHGDTLLAILLKPPPDIKTTNFPRRGSYLPLAFPLAMSSFAETDIVSFYICCDSCALYLVRNYTNPYSETVTGALPLASVAKNQGAWVEALDMAFAGRFQRSDIPTLFIAVLDRMVIENRVRAAPPGDIVLYHDAIQWIKRELLNVAKVPDTLSSSFLRGRRGQNRASSVVSLYTVLSDRAFYDPGNIANEDISMLRYPVPGFMVITRLLRDQGTTNQQLQTYLFQRLMFHMTEEYFSSLKNGVENDFTKSINKLLHRDALPAMPPNQSVSPEVVATASVDMLLMNGLLDSQTLLYFQSMEEFKEIEKRIGPATAVYLYILSIHGSKYSSAIDYFNALKVNSTTSKVVLKPLAISKGLAADLILQVEKISV